MPWPSLLALLALGTGFVLESKGRLSPRFKAWTVRALIDLLYPSLIFSALLLRLQAGSLASLWPLPCIVALILLLGLAIGVGLESRVGLNDDGERRSFRFLCLLPNYSYLPLTVAQALWGDDGMTLVVIASVGADLVLWTVGVPQITRSRQMHAMQLLRNPPLYALLLALLLLQAPFAALRDMLHPVLLLLRQLGSATIPASMLILGAHLGRRTRTVDQGRAQKTLLAVRLLLIPACLSAFFWLEPGLVSPLAQQVLILIASMPGAIVAVILSERYHASPDLAARHILLGHGLWLLTGPFWLWLQHL